jgi:hypothetical protein
LVFNFFYFWGKVFWGIPIPGVGTTAVVGEMILLSHGNQRGFIKGKGWLAGNDNTYKVSTFDMGSK